MSEMRIQQPHSFTMGTAFSLIELLVVIAIIAALLGIGVGTASYVQRKTAAARIKCDITALEVALDNYKADIGCYPSCLDSNAWSPPQPLCVNGSNWSSVVLFRALAGIDGRKVYFKFRADQLGAPGWTNIITPAVINIVDVFGEGLRYRYPGINNKTSFDLWSLGPDRAQGGTANQDNITNWR